MDKISKLIKLKILFVDECYALSNEIISIILDSPLSYIFLFYSGILCLMERIFWLFIFLFESTWIQLLTGFKSIKSNYSCINKKWYVTANPHSISTVSHLSPRLVKFLRQNSSSHDVWTSSTNEDSCNENIKEVVFHIETFEKSPSPSKNFLFYLILVIYDFGLTRKIKNVFGRTSTSDVVFFHALNICT